MSNKEFFLKELEEAGYKESSFEDFEKDIHIFSLKGLESNLFSIKIRENVSMLRSNFFALKTVKKYYFVGKNEVRIWGYF